MTISTASRTEDLDRRRQICSTDAPKKVLLKISGADIGLRFVAPTAQRTAQIERTPTIANLSQGTRLFPYRPGVDDSGYLCVNKANNVRIDNLVEQLLANGYRYIDGHSKDASNGLLVSVIQFELNGKEIEMPEAVNKLLFGKVFDAVYAYANPKNNPVGETQDTINCRVSTRNIEINKAQLLTTEGNLYVLND